MTARTTSRIRLAARGAATVVAILCTAVLGITAFSDRLSFVVVSGDSMEPTLQPGDLVALLGQAAYAPGDVVGFRIPAGQAGSGSLVIHRIRSVSADGYFRLRGDNRDGDDVWTVATDDVVGRRLLVWSDGGLVLMALRSPLFVGTVAGSAAFVAVLSCAEGRPGRRRVARTAPGRGVDAHDTVAPVTSIAPWASPAGIVVPSPPPPPTAHGRASTRFPRPAHRAANPSVPPVGCWSGYPHVRRTAAEASEPLLEPALRRASDAFPRPARSGMDGTGTERLLTSASTT